MAKELEGNPSYLMGGNSHKSKEERRKAAPVTANAAKKRKKALARKALAAEPREIGGKVAHDILVPTLQKLVVQMGEMVLRMAVYGDANVPVSGSGYSSKSPTPYNSMYDRRRQQVRRPLYDFDEVLFDGGGDMARAVDDARAVLSEMVSYLEDYGFVSVAEFYEFSGYSSEPTDNRWGWENLDGACVQRVRDGYVINLPRPRPLEN